MEKNENEEIPSENFVQTRYKEQVLEDMYCLNHDCCTSNNRISNCCFGILLYLNFSLRTSDFFGDITQIFILLFCCRVCSGSIKCGKCCGAFSALIIKISPYLILGAICGVLGTVLYYWLEDTIEFLQEILSD